MKTITIQNPKTSRQIRVRAWDVDTKATLHKFATGEFETARDLSWALLNDDQAILAVEETQYGDAAENNFGLSIFENALDWTLGLAAIRYMQSAPKGKRVKPFTVACSRKGDVYIITNSGQVVAA